MRVLVAQKGSREFFLAARALRRHGALAGLVTDWYAGRTSLLAPWAETLGLRAVGRALRVHSPELPRSLVHTVIAAKIHGCLSASRNGESPAELYLKEDAYFGRAVARKRLPRHDVFLGYSYACLEILEAERAAGRLCVLDQLDPGEKEHEIIRKEEEAWPLYAVTNHTLYAPYFARLRREWSLADVILVNSEWSRDCNVEKGAPREKIELLPLAYEGDTGLAPSRSIASGEVQILWLGRVTLQKGIQYLVEAARLLKGAPVKFLVCGEAQISQESMRQAPSNIQWLGKVGHAEKQRLLSSAAAFVLPTLSDGFALTQLEAFANGLPVITTPNCGRVVENEATGFVIPPRDPQALAEAVLRFVQDRSLSLAMAPRCVAALESFSVEAYGTNLMRILEKAMARRAGNQASLQTCL